MAEKLQLNYNDNKCINSNTVYKLSNETMKVKILTVNQVAKHKTKNSLDLKFWISTKFVAIFFLHLKKYLRHGISINSCSLKTQLQSRDKGKDSRYRLLQRKGHKHHRLVKGCNRA